MTNSEPLTPMIGPPFGPCAIDLDVLRRVSLRCPAFTALNDSSPSTMAILLDRLPQHIAANRPIVVGMAITEAVKVDRDVCVALFAQCGIAGQIRQEVIARKSGALAMTEPLVVTSEIAPKEAPRNV